MSSPFSNPKEFLEAEGPIYTFGNNFTIITFFLIVSAVLFLWFIYASYTIKSGKPVPKNPVVLSLLIAASTVSFAGSVYNSTIDKTPQPSRIKKTGSQVVSSNKPQWQLPMTIVGMVASSSLLQRRSQNRWRKRKTTNRNKYQ
jgi:RsiW-degrading membrane proteinase PrsW (M82 family)